jgi:O-glycosyl hydrolase
MKIYTTKIFIVVIVMFAWSVNVFAQLINVNTNDYKQTIDMIGGDMERSSIAIQSALNKDDILEWSFGNIDFNVCRVQYDKNQELVEGTKNWSFYDEQVATMQDIKLINPDIKFFATMRSDYDGYGDENNLPDWIHDYDTKETDTDKYGIFLADYCEYMSQQGVPIDIISTAKEWYWHLKPSVADSVIDKLNSELDTRGITKPVICDQGFWSITQGIKYLSEVESLGTIDLYDSFCSHNYDNEEPSQWVALIEQAATLGKVVYDDETSTGSGSPTSGVERAMYKQIDEYIKKSERYESGLCGEIYFEIWSRGIDSETRSIYFPSGGTGTRLRGYYMMKHFSNNILDSRYVTATIDSLSDVYTISFRKDDQVVLWIINESTTEYPLVPITVDAYEITDSIDVHYWTDDTDIEGATNTIIPNGNLFEIDILGESMGCYIFDVNDEGENIALSGTATQSSTLDDAVATRAIDETIDGSLSSGSVSQTTVEENPWWQVDLGANDTIGVINIYNITDESYKDDLSNFTVSVMDADSSVVFSQTYTTAPDSSLTIDVGDVIGQIVIIQLNGTNSLSLSEVQVIKGTVFEKMDQTIDFPELQEMQYTTEPFSPGATSSSGLGVDYTSSNLDVATIVDREIVITGVGDAIITASRSESLTYNAASDVEQTLTVTKADQQISFSAIANRNVGDLSFALEATASSALEVTYSSSDSQVATIDGDSVNIVGAGTTIITASQTGDDNYNAAPDSSQTFTVDEAVAGNTDSLVVLTPTMDSYTRGGSYADNNYGSETDLVVKQTSSSDYYRESFLQFDIYDITVVDKALLRLYASNAGLSEIIVYETTDDWYEDSITYNNAPSVGSSFESVDVETSGVYYEWDVTSYIQQEMLGDNLASFIVQDASSEKNSIVFNSKEAEENQPQLVITNESVISSIASNTVSYNSLFSAYPNPAKDFVELTAVNNIEDILVTNITGQQILQLNAIREKQIEVQLDEFSPGFYLFHVTDQKGIKGTIKVLVE